jgi:mannitol/fructose-specific phosphotransferase system IIA component (Ntr-type)
MEFKQALENSCYSLGLKGTTKEEIIGEMVDLMVDHGKIENKDRHIVLDAILSREKKISTGIQHGVAVPHGKCSVVEELVTVVALKKEGVDFGSEDGKPTTIFVMTVSSVFRSGPHLQFLSEISKLLNVPSIREKMLNVETVQELTGLLKDLSRQDAESES